MPAPSCAPVPAAGWLAWVLAHLPTMSLQAGADVVAPMGSPKAVQAADAPTAYFLEDWALQKISHSRNQSLKRYI